MDISDLERYFEHQLKKNTRVLLFMVTSESTVSLRKHNLNEYPFVNLLTELKDWEFEEPSADNPCRLPKFKSIIKE